MTSTPQEPLENPAEAHSDVGYSRGTGEGESAEQAGTGAGDDGGTDYLDPRPRGNL